MAKPFFIAVKAADAVAIAETGSILSSFCYEYLVAFRLLLITAPQPLATLGLLDGRFALLTAPPLTILTTPPAAFFLAFFFLPPVP
jgi:hypothetical protein